MKKTSLLRNRFRSVLARRIFFGSLAILGVVFLGAMIFYMQLYQRELDQFSRAQISRMLDELSPSIGRAIWQLNEENLVVFLDTLTSRDEIAAASYKDRVLDLHSGDKEIRVLNNNNCDAVIFKDFAGFKIEGEAIDYGRLSVCYKKAFILQRTADFFTLNEIPFVLAVFSTSIVFVVFCWGLVIAPLQVLVHKIEEGSPIEEFKRKVFFGFNGEPDEIDVLVDDLVARARSLQGESQLVDILLDEIEAAVVLTNNDHHIIRHNRAFANKFGLHGDIKGMDLSKNIPADWLEKEGSEKRYKTPKGEYARYQTIKILSGKSLYGWLHIA